MGAQGTTFAPCPESLRLIECGEFRSSRSALSTAQYASCDWLDPKAFGEDAAAQKITAGAIKQTSAKLAINLNFTVNLGRIKSENSLILRAS
jgi:hypothetical protein